MTLIEGISICLAVIAVFIALVSEKRMQRMANMELYEKLAIIEGYIDSIRTGQAAALSGAIFTIPGPAQQYVLPFGRVVNDVLGAIELKRYAEYKLRKRLDEEITQLINVASKNQLYQGLSDKIKEAIEDSDESSSRHSHFTDQDKDYVIAGAFASFFIGMMLIRYGAMQSSVVSVVIGALFWMLAIFFAIAFIVPWALGKALEVMKWVSLAIFIGSLTLVIVDWSETIGKIASGNLIYTILLWGGIGFFYLFCFVFVISAVMPLIKWTKTLFSVPKGWRRRQTKRHHTNQLIQDPKKLKVENTDRD